MIKMPFLGLDFRFALCYYVVIQEYRIKNQQAVGAAMVMVLVPMLTAGERTIGGERPPCLCGRRRCGGAAVYRLPVRHAGGREGAAAADRYGYNGMLMTLSMAGGISTIFIIVFLPKILERISRRRFMFLACVAAGVGAAILLLSGLALPREPWLLSFGVYAFSCAFTVGGNYAFYQVLFVDIANTVEYNELKTGRRSEGLIFSLRPLMTQMASGVTQLIAMVDPHTGAELNIDDIVAMCDELIEAHGPYMAMYR